jgi:hypothetical protein
VDALGEVARTEGGTVNKAAQRMLKTALAQWLSRRATEAARAEAQ